MTSFEARFIERQLITPTLIRIVLNKLKAAGNIEGEGAERSAVGGNVELPVDGPRHSLPVLLMACEKLGVAAVS